MPRIKCPYCGAEYGIPEGVTHAVCPYCGVAVEVSSNRAAPTYIYPPRLEEQEAYEYGVSRLSSLPGAPRDIKVNIGYKRGVLHFVQLYIVRVSARDRACDHAREEAYEAILASSAPQGFPPDYSFPVVGRIPYNPDMSRDARIHGISLKLHELEEMLQPLMAILRGIVAREARAFCGETREIHLDYRIEGVAHYPLWELTYTYNGREYRMLVDSVDPRVIYAEYPASRTRLAKILAGFTLGSGIATTAATLLSITYGVAALLGLAVGLGGAIAEFLTRRTLVYKGEKPWRMKEVYGVLSTTS